VGWSDLKKEVLNMQKWVKMVNLFLALILLAFFSLGCAGVSKDTQVKCQKCGADFTIDEGLTQIQKSGGGM
jgi:hypothetical protein